MLGQGLPCRSQDGLSLGHQHNGKKDEARLGHNPGRDTPEVLTVSWMCALRSFARSTSSKHSYIQGRPSLRLTMDIVYTPYFNKIYECSRLTFRKIYKLHHTLHVLDVPATSVRPKSFTLSDLKSNLTLPSHEVALTGEPVKTLQFIVIAIIVS